MNNHRSQLKRNQKQPVQYGKQKNKQTNKATDDRAKTRQDKDITKKSRKNSWKLGSLLELKNGLGLVPELANHLDLREVYNWYRNF